VAPGAAAAAATVHTQVSITFDDGDADQLAALPLLAKNHIHATFYVISGAVGTPGYFTRSDLDRISAAGNEIGGHTASHLNLVDVSQAEARRQICTSRATLMGWGFPVTSFAYPRGATNPAVERMVAECGYRSARLGSGLRFDNGRPGGGCADCSSVDRTPPADPYAIAVPGAVGQTWSLTDLQDAVRTAENRGNGWLPLVFHHVCTNGCGPLSVTPAILGEFLQWLDKRGASGTVTEPVSEVMGGAVRPVVRAPDAPTHRLVNPSLEATGRAANLDTVTESATDPGIPSCWMPAGYGRNTATWRRTSDAHTGRFAEQLSVSNYHDGDAKLLQRFDLGECSLPVEPGKAYTLGAWYKSTAQIQYSDYVRNATGTWKYWVSSQYLPAAGTWTDAVWQTPGVPAGTTAISFGLTLFKNGSLTTDDYTFTGEPGPQSAVAQSESSRLAPPATLAGACLLVLMWAMFVLQRRGLLGTRD
jgi:peptidoglycan/xylan/chitin deacetylase (PgdA/CDA1 family)